MFLLAMLVAQAGVTIATLALAVRRKSVFWLLAAFAGIASIALSIKFNTARRSMSASTAAASEIGESTFATIP